MLFRGALEIFCRNSSSPFMLGKRYFLDVLLDIIKSLYQDTGS